MTKRNISTAIFLATALTLCGCKTDSVVKKSDVADYGAAASAHAPNPDAGKVSGTIRINGKPPARVKIDMSMDPACAMTAAENDAEQYMVSNGKLANVYVYIKAGAAPSKAPANSAPVVLDQKGCRYTPHVIALQQGGSVEFRNSDPTMHNVHTTPTAGGGNPVIDVSQSPMGQPQTRKFSQPETMLPVRCNNHPWMNAFINIADTPYFAVSGADGSFTIGGLPPGNYTVAAVHEKLGEQDMQIVIPPKGAAKADFTYTMK
ncbi:MAG: carboxypeptidase regulatory-like domain-containing protein [Acidobacteriota bacterium]|nr:carboxypeptidase regulatory-like domain-containing protein [Acidobacteriota bacterium]